MTLLRFSNVEFGLLTLNFYENIKLLLMEVDEFKKYSLYLPPITIKSIHVTNNLLWKTFLLFFG